MAMRSSKTIAISLATLTMTTALGGCASVEPSFAIPADCRHPIPSLANAPTAAPSGRTLPDDCLKRIDDTRLAAPR